MIKTTYKANVTKDGVFWFIQLPSHENVFTQARNLDEIESMTRDVISLIFEIPEDSFDLEFIFDAKQLWGLWPITSPEVKARVPKNLKIALEREVNAHGVGYV